MMAIEHPRCFLGSLVLALSAVHLACDHPNSHVDRRGDEEWRDHEDDIGIDIGNGVTIVEPGRTLFGRSYNELTGAWSNWLEKAPIEKNPAFDPDGRFCGKNQEGPIFFLGAAFGGNFERECDVPSDKGIFFPIDTFISFAPEFLAPGMSHQCAQLTEDIDRIRCDVNDVVPIAPFTHMELTIDGDDASDLFAYRAQSQPGGFTLVITDGGLLEAFGFPPGPRFPAVADGYWILLEPLPPGIHTVSFGVDLPDPHDDYSVSYTLNVIDDEDD